MNESSENGPSQNGSSEDVDALVAKWAPLLRLHPGEKNFPMEPMDFIRASRFRHHISGGKDKGYNKKTNKWVTTNGHGSDYYDIPITFIDGFGLDKDGKNRRPRDPNNGKWMQVFLQPNGRPRGNKSPTGRVRVFTYVRQTSQWRALGAATFITYWWFFGYNDGTVNNHQGDWEHCTAAIQGGTLAGAYLAAHHGSTFYRATDLEWKQGHFIVYTAKGSHASYPREGVFEHHTDQTKKGGVEWETWQLLGALADQPWKNFAGAWGEVGTLNDTTGPLGPWYKRTKM